jgi:hypothetical protein
MIYSNLACGKCKIGGVDTKETIWWWQRWTWFEANTKETIWWQRWTWFEANTKETIWWQRWTWFEANTKETIYDKDEHDLRQIQKKLYMTKMNMALAHAI